MAFYTNVLRPTLVIEYHAPALAKPDREPGKEGVA